MGEEDKGKTARIGKLMRELINKQKEIIKELTYGVMNVSDLKACEVLAQKVIDSGLMK